MKSIKDVQSSIDKVESFQCDLISWQYRHYSYFTDEETKAHKVLEFIGNNLRYV